MKRWIRASTHQQTVNFVWPRLSMPAYEGSRRIIPTHFRSGSAGLTFGPPEPRTQSVRVAQCSARQILLRQRFFLQRFMLRILQAEKDFLKTINM